MMDIEKLARLAVELERHANTAFLIAFGIGLLLVVYGTIAKNKWGINLRRVTCPACGADMKRVRMPHSGKQAMWGGYTCPTCQCEMDKWGRRTTENA